MGNKNLKLRNSEQISVELNQPQLNIVNQNDQPTFLDNDLSFGFSFKSCQSQLSNFSSRSWSRLSRKRRKGSTQTLPRYDSSKTSWPVSQLETIFTPEFTLKNYEKDFDIISEINQGSYGKVYKAFDKRTSKEVALKILSKSKIIKENCVRQVKEEVQIQGVCGHHPFIVNCLLHWQNRKKLFIVSELVEGGELFSLLKNYPKLPVVLVQLYVAQIAFALDFLHNAGIIYRDLKPENLLLDASGNLQLIDFGLSKWLSYGQTTGTICGTLRYMAPEIFTFKPYGHAVDWWSLGVIVCLMLTGMYPNDNGKILPEDVELDVPSKDLLLRLLEVDPSKRLRSLRTLQTIAFYKSYNFDKVRNKEVTPNDLLPKHEGLEVNQLSLPASDEVIKME